MYEIEYYVTPDGRNVFRDWLDQLRDKKTRLAIDRRLIRIEQGNLGDHRFCRDGVWELRVDLGPGYRVYYGLSGSAVVVLLCGGDKSTQRADIDRACEYLERLKSEGQDAYKKAR